MRKKFFPLLFLLLFALILPFTMNPLAAEAAAADPAAFPDPGYTLNSIDGTKVSTKDTQGKTTLILFGSTTCRLTRGTLQSIAASSWAGNDDIRVIFAESTCMTREETQEYAENYGCDKITFCYHEDVYNPVIFKVGCSYRNQYFKIEAGTKEANTLSFPTAVFIDKNGQVQKVIEEKAALSADRLKAEIDQISDGENPGNPSVSQPPSPTPQPGLEDLYYSFRSIAGELVPTTSPDTLGKTTILIFGKTDCGLTRRTLEDITAGNLVNNENNRIIFAECAGHSLQETQTYASEFESSKITFCYDENAGSNSIYTASFKYAALEEGQEENDPVTYPLIVLIDENNRIRKITQGAQTSEYLENEIKNFAGTATPSLTPEPSQTPEPTQTPVPSPAPVNVPNVSGLSASSTAESIKLSWSKVSKADGYCLYQYSGSSWKKIAQFQPKSKNSYTVENLKSATNYRFAMKAFIKQNQKQILSKSYTSIYTSTKPAAVKFTSSAGRKKVTLNWKKVKGAAGYTVCYKTSQKAAWKTLKKTKSTKYTKKNLKSGKTYFFTVKAYKTYKGKTYTGSSKTRKVTVK